MSVILGIDACEFSLGVALLQGEGRQTERSTDNVAIAENIISEIDLLLSGSGCSIKDVTLIAVAVGPGSFTGVRSSIAVALGLGRGLNIPYIGVPTLTGRFCANCGDLKSGNYVVAMTANKTELFCYPISLNHSCPGYEDSPVLFCKDNLVVRALSEPFCCPQGTDVNDIMRFSGKTTENADQLPVFIDYFKVDKGVTKISPALSVAVMGRAMAEAGQNCGELEPIYIKAVNAKTLAQRGIQKVI